MSEKQREAQQARRDREREQMAAAAANAANAAAESMPDLPADPTSGDDEPPKMPSTDHSARQQALEQLRQKPDDLDEYIKAEAEDEPKPESTPEPEQPVQAAAETPAAAPEPELVTVKIDGQESQVSKADVDALGGVAAYQIHKAAEKRLAQANQEKQDLHRLLEQAKTLIEQNKPKEPVKSPEESIKEKVAQIQFGTPDEAAQAIQDILNANVQKVDQNAIVAQAVAQMQQQSAAQQFVQRNQDILQNPVLAKLALVLEHDKLSKSRPSDWGKFYTEMEVEFRNSIGRPATTPTPTVSTPQDAQPTSERDAKLSRKDNIVNLPTAAQRAAGPEEPKTLTRDDRLNQLRKARGQPVS